MTWFRGLLFRMLGFSFNPWTGTPLVEPTENSEWPRVVLTYHPGIDALVMDLGEGRCRVARW